MSRRLLVIAACTVALVLAAVPALACGGLVGPNGAVNLLRTTTLAAYHDGVEHYVTSFEYAGAAEGQFGSIVPLPAVPTKVERGGKWTLQRLTREVRPPAPAGVRGLTSAAVVNDVVVHQRTQIDALDIAILEGSARAVGAWAEQNGFRLSPDAPEVLEFYGARSPIFMAARYDASEAARRGLGQGDGTPIHLTIPTANPWVPLRILALGKNVAEPVEADVFLLTERAPALLPAPLGTVPDAGERGSGLQLVRSEAASASLLADLRSDDGMSWLPRDGMWLSYLTLDARAGDVTYDLAIDVHGRAPSAVAAGLVPPVTSSSGSSPALAWIAAAVVVGTALVMRRLWGEAPRVA